MPTTSAILCWILRENIILDGYNMQYFYRHHNNFENELREKLGNIT